MTRIFLCIFFCCSAIMSFSQTSLYTQYIFNPYMLNPAFVAHSGQKEVNVLYRKQWTGIANSPKTLQADFQIPLTEKIGVGVNVVNDNTVLLSNTSLMLTFGYKVRLSSDHILSFGLSGGFLSNRIRLEDLAPEEMNDPALFNTAHNNFGFDGQFGISYNFRHLTVGFSFLNLINNKSFSSEEFQTLSFNQLHNEQAFASYSFSLREDIILTPTLGYRMTTSHDFYETALILSLQNVLDVGVGYRQDYGANALIRAKWDKLEIGYAYDFPSSYYEVSTGGSHEIQVKYKFGEKRNLSPFDPQQLHKSQKHFQRLQKKKRRTPTANRPKYKRSTLWSRSTERKNKTLKKDKDDQEFDHTYYTTEELTTLEEAVEGDINAKPDGRKWYLILGVFQNPANANKFKEILQQKGIETEVKQSKEGRYYVHVPALLTEKLSPQQILDIKSESQYKDAWYTKLD